jgi:GNAT superfamily N-acetyltransferase
LNIKIKEGTIEEVLALIDNIPEITPVTYKQIAERIYDMDFHILISNLNGRPSGFMIGYNIGDDGFYLWLGGIVPDARNKTLGKMLIRRQANRARDKGYNVVKMKTRNKFKPMLALALSEGFNITGVEEKENVEENRIWLEKKIG